MLYYLYNFIINVSKRSFLSCFEFIRLFSFVIKSSCINWGIFHSDYHVCPCPNQLIILPSCVFWEVWVIFHFKSGTLRQRYTANIIIDSQLNFQSQIIQTAHLVCIHRLSALEDFNGRLSVKPNWPKFMNVNGIKLAAVLQYLILRVLFIFFPVCLAVIDWFRCPHITFPLPMIMMRSFYSIPLLQDMMVKKNVPYAKMHCKTLKPA